jgi:1-acyl-sn-glycerol-3-phosphate acyltransferase
MSWLRLIGRVVGLFAVTLWAFVVLDLGLPFRRRPESRARLQDGVFRRWSRGVLWILGVRLTLDGPPIGNANPPRFLVSNHLSYIDIPVLASQLPCAFVAKAEIARWPVAGHACRLVDTLFIDRSRKRDLTRVLAEVHRLLAAGRTVTLFPEGTSGSGDALLPFRSSLLDLPAEAHVPVSHAAIHYTAPPGWPVARQSVCWWGNAPLLPHACTLLRLPWIDARVRFSPAPLHDDDRKRLSQALAEAISRDYEILRSARERPAGAVG